MMFDAQGKIERIVPVQRNDAHRLIEECMLAANVCASDFLREPRPSDAVPRARGADAGEARGAARVSQRLRPATWRRRQAAGRGLCQGCWSSCKGRPDAQLLQTVMLRSLRQAVYSPDNVGHFGLAYEAYTHFTSPIRRYPDLLVHRAIKAVLAGKRYEPGQLAGTRRALLA